MLAVESTVAEVEKTAPPNAAAERDSHRRSRTYRPSAATGIGSPRTRLWASAGHGTSRNNRTGGKSIWRSGSATADCPKPRYGSQNGSWPDAMLLLNQTWMGKNTVAPSR